MKKRFKLTKLPMVVRMMLGFIPTVKTFGIITGKNPLGVKLSVEDNELLNRELFYYLRSAHHSFIKPDDVIFEDLESPFFIVNVALDEMKDIAVKYEQRGFIFGENKGPGPSVFHYIQAIINNDMPLKSSDYTINHIQMIFQGTRYMEDRFNENTSEKFIVPVLGKILRVPSLVSTFNSCFCQFVF